MNSLWQNAVELYKKAIDEEDDPRTQEWPLVYSPWNPITVAAVYIYFCWNVKKLTAKMPTYHIRPLLICYNAFMVALSCYMTYEFFGTAVWSNYNWICQRVVYTNEYLPMRMAKVCWVYYFSKYIELSETVMFAMRKKYNQITFLHCFHHTTMLFVWWLNTKYCAGGVSFLFGGINSFVHSVMYTYYGLAAVGPHMQKYLWWKIHITKLQLSQFVILFFFCINNIYQNCGHPRWLCALMIFYAVSLFVLFLNFYIKAYLAKKRKSTDANGKSASNGAIKRD